MREFLQALRSTEGVVNSEVPRCFNDREIVERFTFQASFHSSNGIAGQEEVVALQRRYREEVVDIFQKMRVSYLDLEPYLEYLAHMVCMEQDSLEKFLNDGIPSRVIGGAADKLKDLYDRLNNLYQAVNTRKSHMEACAGMSLLNAAAVELSSSSFSQQAPRGPRTTSSITSPPTTVEQSRHNSIDSNAHGITPPNTQIARKIVKPKKPKKKKPVSDLRCLQCNIESTPEWRRGPSGDRTLCNACGLYYIKAVRSRGERIAAELLSQRKRKE
jgi:hypothetical protein